MYEDLYTFCTNLVYVTFKRRDYHQIYEEMGDMLRSPTFNPAQRKARPPADDDNSSLHRRCELQRQLSLAGVMSSKPKRFLRCVCKKVLYDMIVWIAVVVGQLY